MFPIGGYVKFHGEMHPGTNSEEEDHPESFAKLARWKRALVIAAGPAANMLVTILIFAFMTNMMGRNELGSTIIKIDDQGSAYSAGVRLGDEILEWNGNKSDTSQDIIRHIRIHPGKNIDLKIKRENDVLPITVPIEEKTITDKFGEEITMGALGIEFNSIHISNSTILQTVDYAVSEAVSLFKVQSIAMGQIATGERSLKEVSGPIRMAKMSGEQASLGWLSFFYFAAMVSIAIAFMNLLPVPGLDGGFLIIYAVEGISRTNLSKKAMTIATKGGYVAIGCLMIFAFSNDIRVLVMQ